MRFSACILFLLLVIVSAEVIGQELYSARGYWEESTKANYLSIKQRLIRGDSLDNNQILYVKDYESYLATYFQRMPENEKQEYLRMKEQWNRDLIIAETSPGVITDNKDNGNFEWRNRDRFTNILYGAFYGGSLVSLAGIEGAAAAGIPLITGGLWLLGPAINPKKYEGITRSTVRANNTGKLLGLGYGAALGLALGGTSEESGKIVFGLASVGSIALGEVAFHQQKKRNTTMGQIDIMRHYGILTPLIGASLLAAGKVDNANLYGLALLSGGVSGLLIGNKVFNKYQFTQGDVDAIGTLTAISAGIGLTLVAESLDNNDEPGTLILVPAATSILGTVLGQKSLRGIHLSAKQGSTLSLSTAGAALIGVGLVAIVEADSPAVIIGVPTVLALITQQMLFHKFKMKNLEMNIKGSRNQKHDYRLSLNITPENYLMNKKIPVQNISPRSFSSMQNSLFNFRLTF